MRRALFALSLVAGSLVLGCQDNAVLIRNTDANLNKSAATFATEAKERFPYPADVQRGERIDARAEIGYMWNIVNVLNYSDQDWENIEIWINKSYVLPLPKMEARQTKRISFKMFYNDQGQYFPLGGTMIEDLEIKKDGVLYRVPCQIGG
jgi:hypothetical protein